MLCSYLKKWKKLFRKERWDANDVERINRALKVHSMQKSSFLKLGGLGVRDYSKVFPPIIIHAKDGESACKICYENIPNVLFKSCSHRICPKCLAHLSNCPFCRRKIQGIRPSI